MNIMIVLIKRLCCALAVMSLFGCGGSSSNTNTGVFVDSAVEGLNYKSDSCSGITGPNGEYQYKTGEVVTFSVGDVVIGSTVGGAVITPLHFGTVFKSNDAIALNIARFLQSLDVDGNLDNGIQITSEIREEMKGRSITFNKANFEDADMTALFASLNARQVFRFSGQGKLRTAIEAQTHLIKTLLSYQVITPPTFSLNTSIKSMQPFFPRYTSIHNLPTVFPRYTTIRMIRPPVFGRFTTLYATFPRLTSSRKLLPRSGVPPKQANPVISNFAENPVVL